MVTNRNRDEFSATTKRALQDRAASFCSNPTCCILTAGPNTEQEKASRNGIASHIYGAAPRGPRYDSLMTKKERVSAANGIWLCALCATDIDKDENKYPAELLYEWKQYTENLVDVLKDQRLSISQIIKTRLSAVEDFWECGHCKFKVPLDATVCGTCGAEVVFGATRKEFADAVLLGFQVGLVFGLMVLGLFMHVYYKIYGLDIDVFTGSVSWIALVIPIITAITGAVLNGTKVRRKFSSTKPRFIRMSFM